MKEKCLFLMSFIVSCVLLLSCVERNKSNSDWLKHSIDVAVSQLKQTSEEIVDTAMLPRSIWVGYEMPFLIRQMERDSMTFKDSLRLKPIQHLGERRLTDIYDWTSGFFPGSLWYLYAITNDDDLKKYATHYTNLLYLLRKYKATHDIGFMVNCSYGNALRFSPNDSIMSVLKQTADNLMHRYNTQIGAIRSWDFGTWNFPVIIDNMMNLELLFYVSSLTGERKYREAAIQHALTTMQHHFRPDFSSYHVVSYNSDGTVELKKTHQGKHDNSNWARGQAWGVYGYTLCFRETGDKRFLKQAENIAGFIMNHVKTDDLIPYWDYDAPDAPDTPRDASAASITASALIELSTMVSDGERYLDYAERILQNLSGAGYLAKAGENCGFILMHSTGSLPNGSEIDTPLNYADYYYLEAVYRYMKLNKISYSNL